MKITVIGTGYVGLVSGICFAKLGHQVVCVDKDYSKINGLKQEIIPIFEPNLKELLLSVKSDKKISFTTDLNQALQGSQAVFIAVGTPQGEDGSADLSYVLGAAQEIAQYSQSFKVIVTKSTVPANTGAKIREIVAKINPQLDFAIVSNPEFLREGSAIEDFMNPDRVIIGVEDEKAKKIMAEIYQDFADNKILYTDIITAELIKYASNSFLATKISFINEMADLCEKTGGDIKLLSSGLGLDSRIGNKFLNPGPGFGGSCFPKDILAILNIASENGVKLSLIDAVIKSNKLRQEKMTARILNAFDGVYKNKKIALLGLAFKGNTDDIRYSPAIKIASNLAKKSLQIFAHDPEAIANAKKELAQFNNIRYFDNAYEATEDADLIVIATEWKNFSELDLIKIKTISKAKKIVDLRNIIDATAARMAGFEYIGIGQK